MKIPLKMKGEWYSNYSDTDEVDKLGRWARMYYYKGYFYAWVCRFDYWTNGMYNVRLYLPSESMHGRSSITFKTWDEAKDFVEKECDKFIKTVVEDE